MIHESKVPFSPAGARRGNAIVLVAGLLVLLVIVATAFLTSARSTRELASAQRDRVLREAGVDAVADSLAEEVAIALFSRPINKSALAGSLATPIGRESARYGGTARFEPNADATRYGVDQDEDFDGVPDVTWNFAPFHVVPWTNWPDELTALHGGGFLGVSPAIDDQWPPGAGAPGNLPGSSLAESNPLGDPGFGDARWLASQEPLSFDPDFGDPDLGIGPGLGVNGYPHAFKMWRHFSYIGRPGNGWRVVADISDVSNTVMDTVRFPVEQWSTDIQPPAILGSAAQVAAGTANFNRDTGFIAWNGAEYDRWQRWLADPGDFGVNELYPFLYLNRATIPHNFFRLDDPDADGVYDSPADTFRRGTVRHQINSVLDDADGDGFTDSFWWLSPNVGADGVRQVVSVRIVDNSAMLNANVATIFEPGRSDDPSDPYGGPDRATRGETPADLALAARPMLTPLEGIPLRMDYNTGLLDSPHRTDGFAWLMQTGGNQVSLMFDDYAGRSDVRWGGQARWEDFIRELRLPIPVAADAFRDTLERRQYWNIAGSRPTDPGFGIQPFTLEDEIELRLFHGNNFTWTMSRFERALNVDLDLDDVADTDAKGQILHGSRQYQESSGYVGSGENYRLDNFELNADVRRHLTLFNATRNDLKPPWLRWRGLFPPSLTDQFPGGVVAQAEQDFLAQSNRKLDLRAPNPARAVGSSAFDTDFVPRAVSATDRRSGERYMQDRLAEEILLALIETRSSGVNITGAPISFQSFVNINNAGGQRRLTAGDETFERMRRIAAALAANVSSRRDDDRDRMEVLFTSVADEFPNVAPLYDEWNARPADGAENTGQTGAVPLPQWPDNFAASGTPVVTEDLDLRMLGMEPQPFLTETMVCFVHAGTEVPRLPLNKEAFFPLSGGGGGGGGGGSATPYFFDRPTSASGDPDDNGTTVVAIQLANPFHHAIPYPELRKYGLTLFGKNIALERVFQAALGAGGGGGGIGGAGYENWAFRPSVDDNPTTITIVICDEEFDWVNRLEYEAATNTLIESAGTNGRASITGFRSDWLRFLNLRPTTAADFASTTPDSLVLTIPWSAIGQDGDPRDFELTDDGSGGPFGGGGGAGTQASDAVVELYRITSHKNADTDNGGAVARSRSRLANAAIQTGANSRVVVDRMGVRDSEFFEAFEALEPLPERDFTIDDDTDGDPSTGVSPLDGIRLEGPEGRFILFPMHARRAWSRDSSLAGADATDEEPLLTPISPATAYGFEPRESAPRYVFAIEKVFGPNQWRGFGPPAGGGTGGNGDPVIGIPQPFRGDLNTLTDVRGWATDMIGQSPVPNGTVGGTGVLTANEYQDTWFWEFMPHPFRVDNMTEEPASSPAVTDALIARRPTFFDGGLRFLRIAMDEAETVRSGTFSPWQRAMLERGLWKGENVRGRLADGTRVPAFPATRSFQMLQKEGDYQQLGELLLTFAVGHELRFDAAGVYVGTEQTFAESIIELPWTTRGTGAATLYAGRLFAGEAIGTTTSTDALDTTVRGHSVPALPGGYRVLGAFVCDGPGFNWNGDFPFVANTPAENYPFVALGNAAGYTGRGTPGLVNVNTAGRPVLGALPNWTTMLHHDEDRASAGLALPAAVVAYRDRFDNFDRDANLGFDSNGFPGGPSYLSRPSNTRGEPGLADLSELLMITRSGAREFPKAGENDFAGAAFGGISSQEQIDDQLESIKFSATDWSVARAGTQPFSIRRSDGPDRYQSTRIGADVSDQDPLLYQRYPGYVPAVAVEPLSEGRRVLDASDVEENSTFFSLDGLPEYIRQEGDLVAGDAEEARLLFNGASNLVTTTSDTFTVYFRVRSFRPGPNGELDATDPDRVISDNRYVMLVDRTGVTSPLDRPRILYMQQVPD